MPMIDATIPAGALEKDAERQLLHEVTDLVIGHELGDPNNERAQRASWIFLHRPEVYVAGEPATLPRYRFIVSVPEGQFDAGRRQGVTADITASVARAERRPQEEVAGRVWVITMEIPDGCWGARGQVVRLPDILSALLGEGGREEALNRMALRAGG